MSTRVIPRLDIKGPNLVKGVHLEGLRVLGAPEAFARHYYETGADELLYMDVVASLYGRNSLLHIVERTAAAIFIPLTVGGGIRTLDDIRAVLRAGADKVAINTAAITDPSLISRSVEQFGSSTVVVSVEAVRMAGGYEAFTDNGRESTGVDAIEWAIRAQELGAGELIVTSVDREGTGSGYDVELTRAISSRVGIPVVACGGAGSPAHVAEVVVDGEADAVSLASLVHYGVEPGVLAEHGDGDEGNTEYLRGQTRPRRFEAAGISDVKRELIRSGIECRAGA